MHSKSIHLPEEEAEGVTKIGTTMDLICIRSPEIQGDAELKLVQLLIEIKDRLCIILSAMIATRAGPKKSLR